MDSVSSRLALFSLPVRINPLSLFWHIRPFITLGNQPTSLVLDFILHTEILTLSSWHALLWACSGPSWFPTLCLSYLLISFTIQVTAQPVFLRKLLPDTHSSQAMNFFKEPVNFYHVTQRSELYFLDFPFK